MAKFSPNFFGQNSHHRHKSPFSHVCIAQACNLTKIYKNAWFLCKLGDFYTIIFLVHIGCWEQCIIFGANWKLCNSYFAQYCTFYINAYFLVIFLVQIGCFGQCTSCQSSAVNVFWCHFRWGVAGEAGGGFFCIFLLLDLCFRFRIFVFALWVFVFCIFTFVFAL